MMAKIEQDELSIALKDGVNGATDEVTVIVDKSGFAGLSDVEKAQRVESAIRGQLPPDKADLFINTLIQDVKDDYKAFAAPEVLDLLMKNAAEKGYNIQNILVRPNSEGAYSNSQNKGGVDFCTIEHGTLEGQVDEMAHNISLATGVDVKDIRKNFTAGDAEHAKRTGAHEAQHCEGSSGLHGEAHADAESYENISPMAALEFRDYRAITAMYDAGHASNPIVMGSQPSGDHFLEAKVGTLHSGVSRVFDSLVEDYMGVDNKTHSSEWSIDEYAEAVDDMKADLIKSANAMPDSPEKVEALMVAEAVINYAEDYEDAYRRRALGEDIPERTPIELLPKDVKTEFYNNHFEANKYQKSNMEALHSSIKENIERYQGAEQSAAHLDNGEQWGWEDDAPDEIGVSLVAMQGDQNRPDATNEYEPPQAGINVNPPDFNV